MTDISDCFLDLEALADAVSLAEVVENKPQNVNVAIEALAKRKILQPKIKNDLDPEPEERKFEVIRSRRSYGPKSKHPESVHPDYCFVGYIGARQAQYLVEELEKRRNGLPKEWKFVCVGIPDYK